MGGVEKAAAAGGAESFVGAGDKGGAESLTGAESEGSTAISLGASQSDFLFREPTAGFVKAVALLLEAVPTFPTAVLSWAVLLRTWPKATACVFPANPCLAPTS